jgi:hypothetical protein
MPPKPATASIGIGVVGSSSGMVALLQWIFACAGLPIMPTEAALGLVTILALLGHGFVKVGGALIDRMAARSEWTPEQRAAATAAKAP